jgi:hypothetical protein
MLRTGNGLGQEISNVEGLSSGQPAGGMSIKFTQRPNVLWSIKRVSWLWIRMCPSMIYYREMRGCSKVMSQSAYGVKISTTTLVFGKSYFCRPVATITYGRKGSYLTIGPWTYEGYGFYRLVRLYVEFFNRSVHHARSMNSSNMIFYCIYIGWNREWSS